MNNALLKSGMVLAAMGVGFAARAQDSNEVGGRFNLSYRAALNVSASFSGVGGYAPPGSPGSGIYNDGFVGVDNSHNAGGYTTYWGYNSASQVSGGNILMHSSTSAAIDTGNNDTGPQNGFELSYEQPLGGGQHWHWGLEAAANWADISLTDNHPFAGSVVTTTDAYSLNGSTAPVAPYTGTASGPEPLLGATPVSHSVNTVQNAAEITGSRKLDANLFGFRLGPYFELPVCPHFAVELGAGLSFGVISSDFSYNEVVAIAGLNNQTHAGSGHEDTALAGAYARAQANVKLFRNVSLIGGVEFNDLGTFDQSVGTETAHLDLSQSIYVSGGLSFSF